MYILIHLGDVFNLVFDTIKNTKIEIRVVNVIGEVVFKETLNNYEGKYNEKINLSKYSNGVYFLEIDSDNKDHQ